MSPINLLGMSFVCFGLAGLGLTCQVCGDLISIPRMTKNTLDWPVLCGMILVALINLVIIVVGVGLAIGGVSVLGGAHG